jgi:hypothetical protein
LDGLYWNPVNLLFINKFAENGGLARATGGGEKEDEEDEEEEKECTLSLSLVFIRFNP